MPTKTQINFRKQMQSYKKEASADKEKVFSYIENDMISDYYSIKPKRVYRKSVPVAAIILLIVIVGVRVYNFTSANVPSASIGITQVIGSIGNGDISFQTAANKNLQELHNYLNDINDLKLKQNSVLVYYNSSVSDFNNGIITQKGFILRIEELIEQISIIADELECIKEAEGMGRYHSLLKEGIHWQSSLFDTILLEQKTGKSKDNNEIKEIREKININIIENKNELIRKFDELGIEYDLNSEGGITYTIKY